MIPPTRATLALALLTLLACGHDAPRAAPASLPAVRAELSKAREVTRPVGDTAVGTVRPRSEAVVAAPVTGTVRAVKVTPGAKVRAGDVLVLLSAGELSARADQARAALAQAKLRLDRATHLREKQAIAEAELDAAQSQHQIAKGALAEADAMLGYLVVRAPIAGVVVTKHADVGDLAVPGRPLVTLESPGALRLEATVPEASARFVSLGQRLPARLGSQTADVDATVEELAPAADPSSRTVLVKLGLPDTPGLRAGTFGRISIPTGQVVTLEVPEASIVRRGQLDLVYVAEGGRARLRLVRPGRERDGAREVLAGLTAGEAVVVKPGSLVDGQPLEVAP